VLFPGVGRVHEIVALVERAGHSTRSITLVFHMVDGPQCRNWVLSDIGVAGYSQASHPRSKRIGFLLYDDVTAAEA